MKRIILAIMATCTVFSAVALAEGNGSGNPRNGGGNEIKITKPPYYIWKDGKLVKNPKAENI